MKMKHLFFILFLIFGMCKLFAAEFDPSAYTRWCALRAAVEIADWFTVSKTGSFS